MCNRSPKHLGLILTVAACLSTASLVAEGTSAEFSPLAFADQHPRLFFRADDLARMREAVKSVPMAKARYEHLVKSANTDLEIAYPIPCQSTNREWTAVAYRMSRNAAKCAFMYQMAGDSRYAQWTKRLLLSWAAEFDTRVNFQLEPIPKTYN